MDRYVFLFFFYFFLTQKNEKPLLGPERRKTLLHIHT